MIANGECILRVDASASMNETIDMKYSLMTRFTLPVSGFNYVCVCVCFVCVCDARSNDRVSNDDNAHAKMVRTKVR